MYFRKFRPTRILIPHWRLHDFLSKNCRLRVAKTLVGKPFCAVVSSGVEKCHRQRLREGREYQDLASKFFCLTLSKKLVVEHFSFTLCLGIENFCG